MTDIDLYLMQHGQATTETEDPERPLTDAGRAAVQRVVKRALAAGVRISGCLHSGKLRAEQTAQLLVLYGRSAWSRASRLDRVLRRMARWAPGSIDTILAGGEPKETVTLLRGPTSAPVSPTSTDALSRTSTEELLLEVRRRIIAPRNRRHETCDDSGGLDPHADWPEEG